MIQRPLPLHKRKVVTYATPTVDDNLSGLISKLLICFANGWSHLAELYIERIDANCRDDDG
jgi:hypothetical protein